MTRDSSSSSSVIDGDIDTPPAVALLEFDPHLATGRLFDCWHILQRSSVDAAILHSSESNIFAFAHSCIYIATVHDLNFGEKLIKEREERSSRQAAEEADTNKVASPRRVSLSSAHREEDLAGALTTAFNNILSPTTGRRADEVPTSMDWQAEAPSNSDNTAHITENAVPDQYRITPYNINEHLATSTSASSRDEASSRGHDNIANSESAPPLDPSLLESSNNAGNEGSDLIGIAYLYTGSYAPAASAAREVSLGVALLPHVRGKGFGTETVRQLMELAFQEFEFHRVSAAVVGPSLSRPASRTIPNARSNSQKQDAKLFSGTVAETEAALRMFVALGFTLEGTKRRTIPDLDDNGAWRDSYHLAMLDTDWFRIRTRQSDTGTNDVFKKKNRRTRWDEMLARHQSETDALLSAESRLKRSASTETLRPGTQSNGAQVSIDVAPSSVYPSSAPSEVASESGEAGGEWDQTQGGAVFSSSACAASASTNQSASAPVASWVSQKPVFLSARAEVNAKYEIDSDSNSSQALNPEFVKVSYDRFTYSSDCPGETETDYGEAKFLINDDGLSAADFGDFHEKVEDFLRRNPAPGPPPSEPATNSDAESDAESFESCADSDADADMLYVSGGINAKGKGKEREVSPQVNDLDRGRIPFLPAGASAATVSLVARPRPASVSASNPPDSGPPVQGPATQTRPPPSFPVSALFAAAATDLMNIDRMTKGSDDFADRLFGRDDNIDFDRDFGMGLAAALFRAGNANLMIDSEAMHTEVLKVSSATVSAPEQIEEQQVRKKRRVSNKSTEEQDIAVPECRSIAPPAGPPSSVSSGVSPPHTFTFIRHPTSSPAYRETEQVTDSPSSRPSTDPSSNVDRDAIPNTSANNANPQAHDGARADNDMLDADTELSDAETISSASTWDVVSSASTPRSPSPTASSLSSATGSLSLQSASESEGE